MDTLVIQNSQEDELLPKEYPFENESEAEEDEENHERLLHVIQSLAKKKRPEQRDEPSVEVSEFHFSHRSDGSRLDPRDLLIGVKGAKQLKQRLEKVETKAKRLSVPLPKPQKERIHRKVAYEQTSAQITRWEPIVRHNMKAEHLSFPIQAELPPPPSLATRVESFQPVTELEKAVSCVLNSSEHVIHKGEQLSEAEKKALLKLSLEEAKERKKELQRMRALMSYYEQKCKRWKKIKSKKFRKIRRKRKEREEAKMGVENEDKGTSLLEKAERLRAQERATLKHTRKSKWAKEQLSRSHRDPGTQLALAEQGALKQELRLKPVADESEESDNSRDLPTDSDEEDPCLGRDAGDCVHDPSNPWLTGKKSTKMRAVSPVLLLDEELKGQSRETSGNILNLREQRRKRKADEKASETAESHDQRGLYDICDDGTSEEELIEICGNAEIDDEALQGDSDHVETQQKGMAFLSHPPNQATTRLDQSRLDSTMQSTESGKARSKSVAKDGNIDPHSFLLTEDRGESSLGKASQHLLAVHEAFAGDDVVEQFEREKSEVVAASLPKTVDTSLPGWGYWGGLGTRPPRKKIKPAEVKEMPKPRKDDGKRFVIISEEIDTKAAKHTVTKLPYLYANKAKFQRAMATPIGRLWNTETTFTEVIKPRVQTAIGTAIEPMKLTDEVQRFIDKTEAAKQKAQEPTQKGNTKETASHSANKKERRKNSRNVKKDSRIKTVGKKTTPHHK